MEIMANPYTACIRIIVYAVPYQCCRSGAITATVIIIIIIIIVILSSGEVLCEILALLRKPCNWSILSTLITF
jgi:hypothetical protein